MPFRSKISPNFWGAFWLSPEKKTESSQFEAFKSSKSVFIGSDFLQREQRLNFISCDKTVSRKRQSSFSCPSGGGN